jgi:hypothetical protein|tara:strand:+ start:145 stop:756 length:612 start_codon:yes stop_codon:yes gene_type:complete
MSLKLTAPSGGAVSLSPPTQTTSSQEITFKLPVADGSNGQTLTTNGSGQLAFSASTPAAGTVVQTLSFFGAEETVGAQITTNKIHATFTPLYSGSKFAVWMSIPNITGQHGAANYYRVYLGTSSTATNNTKVIEVRQRTFGTDGADDLMCVSSMDYGNFTCSGTGTHYITLRLTSGQYAFTVARHSDGTNAMTCKLILQEIKQ